MMTNPNETLGNNLRQSNVITRNEIVQTNATNPRSPSWGATNIASISGSSSSGDGGIVESGTLPNLNDYGFTSAHQNNFGIPIEEDERILQLLNEELARFQNRTTTPRLQTTSTFSAKVSPTLPLLRKESATERLPNVSARLENDKCVSTSLSVCRGALHYDLTSSERALTADERTNFTYLIESQCSPRAAQFLCLLFEPECRPRTMATLPPCKRFCKCQYLSNNSSPTVRPAPILL